MKEEDIKAGIEDQIALDSIPENYLKNIFKITNPRKSQEKFVSWVLEVHPAARRQLLKTGKIYIAWCSFPVKDFLRATRCFPCQRYGHVAKHCNGQKQCGFCASTDHESKECEHRNSPNLHNIANCLRSGMQDTKHHAAGNKCPIYQHRLKEEINDTIYTVDV